MCVFRTSDIHLRNENRLKEKTAQLTGLKLGIRDEIDSLGQDQFGPACLFQLVSERYEHGSMILTSNKSYADWGSIFQDNPALRDQRHSGPVAAPPDHDQYQGGEVPDEGQEKSWGPGEDPLTPAS